MTYGRSNAGCYIHEQSQKLIVAAGKKSGWEREDSVEIFDIAANNWSFGDPMPNNDRSWRFFTIHEDNTFYAYQTEDPPFLYDVTNNAWITTQLPFTNGVPESMWDFAEVDIDDVSLCQLI
jgi:hypothetical protein